MTEEVTKPSWMLGVGLETDMTPDITPGSGKNLRFWMPKGTERSIVFLTEGNRAQAVWEHQIKLGGKYQNWFSCLEPLGVPCPLCKHADENDGQGRRYKGLFFTVIDCHEFEDRAGKKRSNEKKLLCCKKDTSEILKRKYLSRLESDEGLKGAMFKVYRPNSDKSVSVGEDFEFSKMVDLATLPDRGELDYVDLLQPSPEKVNSAYVRLLRESGRESEPLSSGKAEGTATEVPY